MVLMAANISNTNTSKPVVIKCGQPAGMVFMNMSSLTLRGLIFQYCGQNFTSESPSALWFENVMDLELFAVHVWNSTGYGVVAKNILGIINESTFLCNKGAATHNGGNFFVEYSTCVAFPDQQCLQILSSKFSHGQSIYKSSNTSLATGLSVIFNTSCANLDIFLYNVSMEENYNSMDNGVGGNMFIHFYNSQVSNYIHITESKFVHGKAAHGGGIGVTIHHSMVPQLPSQHCCKNLVYITNSEISHNSGVTGCGLYIEVLLPVIEYSHRRDMIYLKNVSLLNNQAKDSEYSIGHNIGVAIFILNGYFLEKVLPVRIKFDNITVKGSKTKLYSSSADSAAILSDRFWGELTIINSNIIHNEVSGISLVRSRVSFLGNILISNNSGINGGGLVLCGSSYIQLTPGVTITFTANKAATFGGAIYSRVSCRDSHPTCFYQVLSPNNSNIEPEYLVQTYNGSFLMENNTAGIAGQDIYAGNVANCHFYRSDLSFNVSHNIFYKIFHVQHNSYGHFSTVTSDPIRVCICDEYDTYNCTVRKHKNRTAVYPGQTIYVRVVLVGQLDGTVPGTALVNGVSQVDIKSTEKCSSLPITVLHNTTKYVVGSLYIRFSIKEYFYHLPNDSFPLIILVNITNCPIGFILINDICICNINNTGINNCNISNSTITTRSGSWVGYNNVSDNMYAEGIIYNNVCPLDYCNSNVDSILVNAWTIKSDMQCSQHRTGLLCGACKSNYSIVVGNTRCMDCRKKPKLYALLITVLLILASTILIVLLGVFNVSVTDGTLAGLLFYANILYANNTLFRFTDRNILTIFIAVLNLDTGVGTCFYNGMDTYAKTWFQLCIPIFLWLQILGIIVVSGRSDRVARLVGDNAAKILATLIELSFNRALRACISSLSFTVLEFPSHNGTKVKRYVWLYDANIDYLRGIHIPLFLVGGLLSVFLLAYTSVLLFVQPLQRYSHVYCFSWVSRLKPLIDAYTAPNIIKSRCRFWGGLLLLLRIILSIYFAINVHNRPDNNLVAIVVVCLILSTVVFSAGGVYKTIVLNTWNAIFILNLVLLSIAIAFIYDENRSLYLGHIRNPQLSFVIVDISTSLVFVMFVGLTLYYIIKRYFKLFKNIYKKVRKLFKTKSQIQERNALLDVSQDSICHTRLAD